MTILQIKGTKQEIKKILDLFHFMETTHPYPVEHCVELRLHKENGMHETDMLVVSSTVDLTDDEADDFVTKMLTGVYND